SKSLNVRRGKLMAVKTKFPYDKKYIEQYSQERSEPEWVTSLRLDALDQADSLELPKPDKTRIERWNFTNFKHQTEAGESVSLDELPAELKEYFDEESLPENLIIQRNQTVAHRQISTELSNKGVIFTDIITAFKEHGELVKKYY